MSHLIKNIDKLKNSLSDDITIVIATKYASLDDIKVISDSFQTSLLEKTEFNKVKKSNRHFQIYKTPGISLGIYNEIKLKKSFKITI